MRILVMESSTTSAKAMLYDTETKKYDVETQVYRNNYDDPTIHVADNIFAATIALGRSVIQGRKVDAVALGGTWHSVMLVNKDMTPATPVYLWSNTEASGICQKLRKDKSYTDWFYHRTGCMVNAIYPVFKLMLLKEKGYDLSSYYIMGQGSYNYFKLTRERIVMDSMASGTGLLNIHDRVYDREILQQVGIEERQLSKIVPYGETYPLSPEGAELLGIDAGIPVIATGPDGGLNQLGSGATEPGVMTFSVGTSGAIRLSVEKPVIPDEPSTWCYYSPLGWLSGAATSGSTNCIDWYRNLMPDRNMSYAEIEQHIDRNVEPPVFLPFLFGERAPGWQDQRSASFHEVKPYHGAYDFYHAIMFGILFNLYQNYVILSKLNGTPKKIMLSGGILNSPYWTQLCADIFNAEMTVHEVEHASLIGGVVLGMKILGQLDSPSGFLFGEEKTVRPNEAAHRRYMAYYEKYLHWYHAGSVR